MTGIEVGLVLFGIICICISFFVSRGSSARDGGTAASPVSATEVWNEKDEQIVRERIQSVLSEQQQEYVDMANDQMGRICNEKIMAVDEYAKQILEKIDNNHQEVVFIYNLLNEKQKEIKSLMAERAVPAQPPASRAEDAQADPVPAQASAQAVPAQPPVQPAPAPAVTPAQTIYPDEPAPSSRSRSENLFGEPFVFPELSARSGLEQVLKRKGGKGRSPAQKPPAAPAVQAQKPVRQSQSQKKSVKTQERGASGDTNQQIQKLYNEGKSVLEISRALNIGQGEVKLVIALYGGRKG